MECRMQGVMEAKHRRALSELLNGIFATSEEPLDIHRIVYRNDPAIGATPCEVSLECSLSSSPHEWHLVHRGGSLRGSLAQQLPCEVRSVERVRAGATVLLLPATMGLTLHHELLLRGFSVSLTHRTFPIQLTCCSLLRMASHSPSLSASPHDVASAQPLALALAGRAPTGHSALTAAKQQQQQPVKVKVPHREGGGEGGGGASAHATDMCRGGNTYEREREWEWECEAEELVVVEAAAMTSNEEAYVEASAAVLSFADLISPLVRLSKPASPAGLSLTADLADVAI